MTNFCTNCRTELGKNDKFCTNCGTEINKSDIRVDIIEKKKAREELKRVVGGKLLFTRSFSNTLFHNGLNVFTAGDEIKKQVEKEIESGHVTSGMVENRVNQLIAEYKTRMEKEKKKSEMIDEIFESEEIKSEIIENRIEKKYVIPINDTLKDKIINKKENMSEDEIKNFIKSELKNAKEEQEKDRIEEEKARKSEEIEISTEIIDSNRGYCNYTCIHYCEQYLDLDGGMSFDFTGNEIIDHYCALGHSLSYGSCCKDYES